VANSGYMQITKFNFDCYSGILMSEIYCKQFLRNITDTQRIKQILKNWNYHLLESYMVWIHDEQKSIINAENV
jgi:6-phosphogluconate dehydrogenase